MQSKSKIKIHNQVFIWKFSLGGELDIDKAMHGMSSKVFLDHHHFCLNQAIFPSRAIILLNAMSIKKYTYLGDATFYGWSNYHDMC